MGAPFLKREKGWSFPHTYIPFLALALELGLGKDLPMSVGLGKDLRVSLSLPLSLYLDTEL